MKFLRCLVPFLALAVLAAPVAAADTDFAWLEGLSLVLLESDSAAELHAARSAIHAAGGRIGLLSLPNVLVGWIPPEADATLLQRGSFRSILRDAGAVSKVQAADPRTRAMLSWFEAVQTGTWQEQARRRAAKPSSAARPADGLLPEPADPIDYLHNLQDNGFHLPELRDRGLLVSKGSGDMPRIGGNSDRMTGTVSVTLLFIESDGTGADPDLYTWTPQHQQQYLGGVNAGLLWWSSRAALYNDCWVAFFVHPIPGSDPRNQQWREMVLHPSGDVASMASEVMANHGYASGNHFSRVEAFNTAQRAGYGTDWAYTAFVAYNPSPASDQLTNGSAAFAYLLGPYTFLLFRSYTWDPNQVFTHETGHIFGACDEYAGGCSGCGPCLDESNGNCVDCPGGNSLCMMKENSFAVCGYTDDQLGWHDLNPCAPPVLAAPGLDSIQPASLPKGVTAQLTLTGSNFLYGAFPSLGSGVLVDSTVVVSPDTMHAFVRVTSIAPISTRNVVVTNRDLQTATLTNAFSVTDTRTHYQSSTGSNVYPYITPAQAATNWADAIAAADSGDSVLVETGSIDLGGGYILNRGVRLYGGYSNDFTVRDLENDRTVLDLTGGSLFVIGNDPASLDGFVLENGAGTAVFGGSLTPGDYGGALHVDSNTFELRNSVVRNNQATDGSGYNGGGGFFARDALITIDNVVFHDNSANRGGAVYLHQSSGSISNSTFANNSVAQAASGGLSPWGAGLFLESCGGSVVLTNNVLDTNTGAAVGGGLAIVDCDDVSVTGGSITGHTVSAAGSSGGGGIDVTGSSLSLHGVEVSDNSAGFSGGGLRAANTALVLEECVFASNMAPLNAGVSATTGTASVRHCLFRANQAQFSNGAGSLGSLAGGSFLGNSLIDNEGAAGTGGVAFVDSPIDVRNNIVVHSVGHGFSCSGAPPSVMDYNLVWGSSGNDWEVCTPGSHALSADPLFAAADDDHLGLHSPALDSGDPDGGLVDPDGSRGDRGRYGSHAFATLQPSRPQNLAAAAAGSDVVLTWSANPETDIITYAVYCDSTMDFVPSADNFLVAVAAPDTSVQLPVHPCDWWTVAAVDTAGYSSGFATRVQQGGDPTDAQAVATWRLQLHPNRPNPFNPVTRIAFELDRERHVRVAVYDLAGRLVRQLVDRRLEAGRHATTWDGRDSRGARVSSGVYFSRLESGDVRQSRKMVLLK